MQCGKWWMAEIFFLIINLPDKGGFFVSKEELK